MSAVDGVSPVSTAKAAANQREARKLPWQAVFPKNGLSQSYVAECVKAFRALDVVGRAYFGKRAITD